MLSRILEDTGVRVVPAVWRSNGVGHTVVSSHPECSPELQRAAAAAREAENKAIVEVRVRQAFEEGLRQAEANATRAAEEQVRAAVERLAASAVEVAGTRATVMRKAEADIVRLSTEIARRVLHRELSVDPSALQALVRAALEKLRSQEIYRVRVHPDQEQLVRACLQQAGRDAAIEVVGDPAQARGGAVFEIGSGSLDASVETQLREIERGLADQLGEQR
jgi:flagellar assembly protein FliH